MSVTTSTSTVSRSVLTLLNDYELHHSNQDPNAVAPSPNPRESPARENPDWWPTDHRRIPDYRPVNRNLRGEQRPNGSNFVETLFIFTMLSGVTINAHASTLWRNTGGRINEKIFSYPIGGER